MNTLSHRLIFNRKRGCRMAVAETASSQGKSSGESSPSSKQTRHKARFTWSFLSLQIAIALSLQTMLALPLSYAASVSQSQQGQEASSHSTSINFALSRSQHEGYSANTSTALGGTLTGTEGINIQAGGLLQATATNITSSGQINLSGAAVVLSSALNSVSTQSSTESKSSGVLSALKGGGQTSTETTQTSIANMTLNGAQINVNSGGQMILGAVQFNGNTSLTATNLTLATLTTTDYASTQSKSSNLVWQSASGSGHLNQDTAYNTFSGTVQIAADKITVGMSVRDSAATLAKEPGMAWISSIQNDPALKDKIDWKKVEEAHKNWNYSQSGLSPAGAAILAIAVSIATGGAGASAAASMMGTTATATMTAGAVATATFTGAAIAAGVNALITQAVIGLVNNGGDLSKTLTQLGSSSSIKGLVTTMLTAGAIQGLSDYLPKDIASANAQSTFGTQLQRNLINNTAGALVSSAVNGTSLEESLKSGIVSAFISTGAAQGANAIGSATLPQNNNGVVTPGISTFAQMFAHAALGCVSGAAKTSGASGQGGCSAGAVGAVVGEIAAQTLDPDATGGARTVQLAGLAGAIAVAINGGTGTQVNIGAAAASNAVENNYLKTAQLKDAKFMASKAAKSGEASYANNAKVETVCVGADLSSSACASAMAQVASDVKELNSYKDELQAKLDKATDPNARQVLSQQISQVDKNIGAATNTVTALKNGLDGETVDFSKLTPEARGILQDFWNQIGDGTAAGTKRIMASIGVGAGAGASGGGANKPPAKPNTTDAPPPPPNRQQEVKDLFDPQSPVTGIQMGNRSLTAQPSSGGAKVFAGASEAEIKDYFKQLAGSSDLPQPIPSRDGSGVVYVIPSPQGNFMLRNASRDPVPGYGNADWTIDVPKTLVPTGTKPEIKFTHSKP